MARIAKGKTIKKNATVPFEFTIKEKDIKERMNFGAYEVIITNKGAMFKSYTGYHVFFSPYTVGPDGKAHETSAYNYLVNLVNMAKAVKGHEQEPFNGDAEVTNGELLEVNQMICAGVLSHPITAFIDLDYAAEFAKKYAKWLEEMANELEETINTPVEEETEEDMMKNKEHEEKAIAIEQINNELNNK